MRSAVSPLVVVLLAGCGVNKKILEFLDADGDGYYPSNAEEAGATGPWDCDETNAGIHPGATEVCDGVDNDCEGSIDGGSAQAMYYPDIDGDGHGNPEFGVLQCDPDPGWITTGDDCDDGLSSRYPDAEELCDGLDNDCDDVTDEDTVDGDTYYVDLDGDGFGDSDREEIYCDEIPDGLVEEGDDCDDANESVYPGAPEEDCTDPTDYNCDGSVDYADADGDGAAECEDCDDTTEEISPDAEEICGNGIDDNCNDDSDNCVRDDTYEILDADSWSAQLLGSTKYEQAGLAVLGGYDFTGDGDLDTLVASPYYTNSSIYAYSAGRVALISGMPEEESSLASPDASIGSTVNYGYFGSVMAGLPDWNANGSDELLVGQPASTYSGSSAAYVFAGGVSGSLTQANATATITCGAGGADYSRCGAVVGPAGDMNDDNVPDFLVSAPYLDANSVTDSGRVALFYGPKSGTLTFADAQATFTGSASQVKAGQSASTAGDVDGDGTDDLVIGAPSQTVSYSQDGAAWLYFGPVSGDRVMGTSNADAWVYGSTYYQYMGTTVAGLGDMNEDGYDDFAAAAPYADSSKGTVYLFNGASTFSGAHAIGTANASIAGSESGQKAGTSVLPAGDVNGDGHADLLVAASEYDTRLIGDVGAVYLGYGPFTGTRTLASIGANSGALWVGGTYYGRLGFGISAAGDVNDDGYDDILFGEPGYNATAYYSQEGAAYLVVGGSL